MYYKDAANISRNQNKIGGCLTSKQNRWLLDSLTERSFAASCLFTL